jgi:hypothetical protein
VRDDSLVGEGQGIDLVPEASNGLIPAAIKCMLDLRQKYALGLIHVDVLKGENDVTFCNSVSCDSINSKHFCNFLLESTYSLQIVYYLSNCATQVVLYLSYNVSKTGRTLAFAILSINTVFQKKKMAWSEFRVIV